MNADRHHILVVGGGIAGLTAADELAALDFSVTLLEKAPFLGGHGIQLSCKAADTCVKCGACLVQEKLSQVLERSGINILTDSSITEVSSAAPFTVSIKTQPPKIISESCTRCGICEKVCPVEGAIFKGFFPDDSIRINSNECLHFKDLSCSSCQENCPEKAIDLDCPLSTSTYAFSAVILATGFQPFHPGHKPYGYTRFKNVITTLELERMLRRKGDLKRPSDDRLPDKLAFIQCVGSRDAASGHLWCSAVCCASAMRLAGWIKNRHPALEITIYYADIQTFGKNFQRIYAEALRDIRWVRTLPGDVFEIENNRLKINYFDPDSIAGREDVFDLIVLSVGMTPHAGAKKLAKWFSEKSDPANHSTQGWSFLPNLKRGVFPAGAAHAPMGIAETISHATDAAYRAAEFSERSRQIHTCDRQTIVPEEKHR